MEYSASGVGAGDTDDGGGGDPHPPGIQRIWRSGMKIMDLRKFLRVACLLGVEKRGSDWVGGKSGGTPPPCFLQEYDSMGVNRWGCAKDVILWELGKKQIKVDPSAALWASSLKLKRERFGQLN